MKFFIKHQGSFLLFFSFILLQQSFVQTSSIEPDEDGLSTVQADLDRIKFGLTEIQERTQHISLTHGKIDAFTSYYKDMTLKFGGKITEEMFGSGNLTFLNNNIPNDSSVFLRATGDFFMDAAYGKVETPRILSHLTLRLRYRWGYGSDAQAAIDPFPFIDALIQPKSSPINKHLLWNRELWIKFALGCLEKGHFVEIGSFPYEVGRGISFGPAYKSAGFLGFTPSFSIDQFAPGILLRIAPVVDKAFVDVYLAVLDNQNISFKTNNVKIRTQEIGTPDDRGTGRQSYAAITKGFCKVIDKDENLLSLEPYIVFFRALDQKLEYVTDVDSFVTTYGFAVEGKYRKFAWGFEGATNRGTIDIKAFDRNTIKLARDSNGFVVEQYTKVFSQDPAIVDCPSLALVTDANKCIVKNSSQIVAANGKEILDTGLYNAYDRIRPKQEKLLDGYMFVGDCSYQWIDDVLNISLGAGYASGDLSKQQNMNNPDIPLTQKFSSFITIQSIYSGTRLRQLIIFNEGVPRFSSENPNGSFPKENITPPLSDASVEFTNIAFAGTRVEWKIPQWKRYKAVIAPNIIGYWCPETPVTKTGAQANNFMGTEVTTEISAQFYKQFKLYGYVGAFFPGGYYKDMCGTLYNGEPTGSDIGYLANIGVSFAF